MYIKQITGIIGSSVSLEGDATKLKVERHSVCCELGCRFRRTLCSWFCITSHARRNRGI